MSENISKMRNNQDKNLVLPPIPTTPKTQKGTPETTRPLSAQGTNSETRTRKAQYVNSRVFEVTTDHLPKKNVLPPITTERKLQGKTSETMETREEHGISFETTEVLKVYRIKSDISASGAPYTPSNVLASHQPQSENVMTTSNSHSTCSRATLTSEQPTHSSFLKSRHREFETMLTSTQEERSLNSETVSASTQQAREMNSETVVLSTRKARDRNSVTAFMSTHEAREKNSETAFTSTQGARETNSALILTPRQPEHSSGFTSHQTDPEHILTPKQSKQKNNVEFQRRSPDDPFMSKPSTPDNPWTSDALRELSSLRSFRDSCYEPPLSTVIGAGKDLAGDPSVEGAIRQLTAPGQPVRGQPAPGLPNPPPPPDEGRI